MEPIAVNEVDEAMAKIQAAMVKVNSNVIFLPGLTAEEFGKLESKYGFKFPPELKRFLAAGIPLEQAEDIPGVIRLGGGWYNWRELAKDEIVVGSKSDVVTAAVQDKLASDDAEADDAFSAHVLEEAAKHPLIPLFGHRMMPSVPHRSGNPVYSLWYGYDFIPYGDNFWQWLWREFLFRKEDGRYELSGEDVLGEAFNQIASTEEQVPFWSEEFPGLRIYKKPVSVKANRSGEPPVREIRRELIDGVLHDTERKPFYITPDFCLIARSCLPECRGCAKTD
jgi:hypothetical protein